MNNKLPEIGELVYHQKDLKIVGCIKSIHTENLLPKRYNSSSNQHVVNIFGDFSLLIVSRAPMGHLICWGSFTE